MASKNNVPPTHSSSALCNAARSNPSADRLTNGPCDRIEDRWMTSATFEMPVPAAPDTKTSVDNAAAARTCFRNVSAAVLSPNINRAAGSEVSICCFSFLFSKTSKRVFNARSSTGNKTSAPQGFSRKSNAPLPTAFTAIGMSPSPVKIIKGSSASMLCT